jgi:adenine-specific DNA-methyltransferase
MIGNKHLSVEDLIRENERLKALIALMEENVPRKKYGLVWEKEADIVSRSTDALFLKEITDKCVYTSDVLPLHRLIEGDNYQSLYLLLQTHRQKVDLIYIDPPYNTGNRDFKFKDSFSDNEAAYRHSRWIAFMEKRLWLAKQLLAPSGVIFISIDDTELAQTKLLCDEVFGEKNFVANFIRKCKTGSGHDSGKIAIEFDYMLCYAKDKSKQKFNKQALNVASDAKYRFADSFVTHRGKYYLRDLDYKGSYSSSLDYPIQAPDGTEIWPGGSFGRPNTWRWSREKFEWGLQHDFIVFKRTVKQWKVYIKQYQYVDNQDKKRVRELPHRAMIEFINSKGSNELKDILHEDIFTHPKPVDLIKFIISLMPGNALTILDFFAGSGTTGHAVLNVNQEKGTKHQFILCTNNENGICEKVCYERLRRVIYGYDTRSGKYIKGTGGNLSYWRVVEV